jgi:hypothetical protein
MIEALVGSLNCERVLVFLQAREKGSHRADQRVRPISVIPDHDPESIMSDAYEDRFDVAMLISGDSDLTGPVEAIRKIYPQKKIIIAFPNRISIQLKQIANASFVIGRKKFKDSQLPDQVLKRYGRHKRSKC